MTFARSCPGTQAIREPTPEYIKCPNCGEEVEVWSHELYYPCPNCGTKVFREQRPSCIDWCSYAKECIGPQFYETLRTSTTNEPTGSGKPGLLGVLFTEHTEALKQMGLMRAAVLCLKAGEKASGSPPRERALSSLNMVLQFLDKDLRKHFQREEESLFPALERHISQEGGPVQVLLKEHAELWRWVEQLKNAAQRLPADVTKPGTATVDEVYQSANHLAKLLQEHIARENTSLLPIAESLLTKEELIQTPVCSAPVSIS